MCAHPQQKRGRFDASGTVTSPAFRRKLEALPNSTVSGVSDAPESSATRRGDFEDAAAAFKARALAFVSLRSTADEHGAMNGVLEALAALAAGERETRRLFFSEKSTGDGEKRAKNAPPPVAANQDATREPIEPAYSLCLDCVLDVLFLPNSRPLHRAIVTAPRAFPPRARSDAEKALVGALGDRVAAAREPLSSLEKKETASSHGHSAARLRVLGVVFSVASCQPQTAADRRVVRAVAVDAAALIGEGAAAFFSLRFFLSAKVLSEVLSVASNAKRPRHPKMRRLERDEFSFQKLELPSQARMFGAMEPGPLGAVANGFT